MGERPKVPRRPMTHEERVLALHLAQLRYGSRSWFARRFARDMAAEAGADEPTITDRQAAQMQRQAWTHRKQLAGKGLERLVPASEPPPPEPRPPPATAPRTARVSRRALEQQAKLARLKQGRW